MAVNAMWKWTTAAGVLLLALEGITLLPIRARLLLVIYAACVGVLVLARRRWLLAGPFAKPVLIGFAASVLPIGLGLFLGHEDGVLVFVEDLLPTLVGWTVLLTLLPLADSSPPDPATDRTPGSVAMIGLLFLAFGALALAHQLAVGRFAIVSDEIVMLTQSRWMQFPQVAMPMAPDVAPFFLTRKIDYLNGQLYGMYPPGWPALLAVFRYASLEWWSIVVLGAASVAMTWWIGRRLDSRKTGFIAAVLLATSQVYLVTHAGYMSHAASIAVLLAATSCLLVGIDASGWRRVAAWMAAGAFLGFGVTVRPLTGIVVGTSVGLWMMLRAWKQQNAFPIGLTVCVIAGAMLPAAFFVYYNLSVFGEPLAIGYDVMHPGLYSLGFGERGFRVRDANLNWVPNTFPFEPRHAMQRLSRSLVAMNTAFIPIGLLLPIAATAVASGYRIPWRLLALFAPLPVILFFYWGTLPRLYTDALPFLVLGAAVMLAAIHTRWPRLGSALTGMVILSHAIVAIPKIGGINNGHRPWAVSDYGPVSAGRRSFLQTVDSLAQEHSSLLLFSRETTRFDSQLHGLYVFNGRFDGPVLVARDLGQRNSELMRRYPERVAYIVEQRDGSEPATFSRMAPP